MQGKYSKLLEAAGDEGIGSVLVELARKAADQHMAELSDSLRSLDSAGGTGRARDLVTNPEARS